MLKQSLFVLIASIIVILFLAQLSYILYFLLHIHYLIAKGLATIFAGGQLGDIIRNVIALFIIPFLIAVIPTALYWAATRTKFAYFTHIFWVSWLIMATMLIAR